MNISSQSIHNAIIFPTDGLDFPFPFFIALPIRGLPCCLEHTVAQDAQLEARTRLSGWCGGGHPATAPPRRYPNHRTSTTPGTKHAPDRPPSPHKTVFLDGVGPSSTLS